ncbi:hypothetical protein RR48_05696 [Papilio machaon]|uniref:MICOS complex subunit MIC13 n=1 Tax=Papilio machaon TaxID=76193 RepID=A0A0N1PH42_PAPMA|nr:uncharacterized protein LOC106716160 [Papilio machaon]KPJ10061.1 hypothetical protein RR48_05696 [Papilio machaon]
MCDNKERCEPCRTINLAKHINQPKPDMQIYDKCTPPRKIECGRVTELPIHPTCINICTKELQLKSAKKLPKVTAPYAHGKLMYLVKAGILVGTAYFTYSQGVWGDQNDSTECIRRWQEYMRSINTRKPPLFDKCGRVVKKENNESLLAPLYSFYKSFVTTCFSGIVKIPVHVKCAYLDYLKALERKEAEEAKERKLRKERG